MTSADEYYHDYKQRKKCTDEVSAVFRLDSPPDAITTIGGVSYLYFGGDGYLGLQADPRMIDVACKATLKYGMGTATSRNCFIAAPIHDVEDNAAIFFKTQRSYYTLDENSAAELLLSVLANKFERAFVDEISAPFWKALFERVYGLNSKVRAFSQKELVIFKHCDVRDLQKKLDSKLFLGERPLLLTDGVFANLGDIAPLKEYEKILKNYGFSLILVDDSHGVGVIGSNFRGTLDYWGFDFSQVNQAGTEISFDLDKESHDDFLCDILSNNKLNGQDIDNFNDTKDVDRNVKLIMFASLAKAFGGFGCIIPGSELFVDELKEYDQGVVTPPNSVAASTAYALQMLSKNNKRCIRLRNNINYLRNGLKKIGIDTGNSQTPIVAFQVGSVKNMKRIQKELEQDRTLISFLPIRFQDSLGVLRLAVFSTHTREHLDMLLESVKRCIGIQP